MEQRGTACSAQTNGPTNTGTQNCSTTCRQSFTVGIAEVGGAHQPAERLFTEETS